MIYLISPHKKQYKANLHCHSTASDGKNTPQQLKEIYQRHGYSILAITDHEIPVSHHDLTEPGFLMLTGYEAYIRPSRECKFDPYQPETHLNLIARHPDNVTMICYNPAYCKYASQEFQAQMPKVGSQRTREHTREYINEFIRTAKEHGYLVTYNHPYWSMEAEEDILAYEGYFSMEICNYNSYKTNHLEYNGALYDKMLIRGKRVFCHGSDDNHDDYPEGTPYWDSCGSFTMILAEELAYDSVIEAMESGGMYFSMGPRFREVSLDGKWLHVECSEVVGIYVYSGSKTPKYVLAEEGQVLTGADIAIDKRSRYVRVSIVDRDGKIADTRGYFRDELGLPRM